MVATAKIKVCLQKVSVVHIPPTMSMLIEPRRIQFPIWQHLHPICSFTLW